MEKPEPIGQQNQTKIRSSEWIKLLTTHQSPIQLIFRLDLRLQIQTDVLCRWFYQSVYLNILEIWNVHVLSPVQMFQLRSSCARLSVSVTFGGSGWLRCRVTDESFLICPLEHSVLLSFIPLDLPSCLLGLGFAMSELVSKRGLHTQAAHTPDKTPYQESWPTLRSSGKFPFTKNRGYSNIMSYPPGYPVPYFDYILLNFPFAALVLILFVAIKPFFKSVEVKF